MAATITKLPTAAASPVVNPPVHWRTRRSMGYIPNILFERKYPIVASSQGTPKGDEQDDVTQCERRSLIALDVTDLSPADQSRVQGFADGLRAMRQGV